jgi:hypothetical protein
MWTERVRLHRSAGSGTFSELTLIDPTDLVFGDDEITAPLAPHAKQKGWKKRR